MKWIPIFLLTISINATAEETHSDRLAYIEEIRLNNITEAKQLLQQIEPDYSSFSAKEKAIFHILKAHSAAMHADYVQAIKSSDKVSQFTQDHDLLSKAKSIAATVNMLQGNYQQGFIGIYELLDDLERIKGYELKNNILRNALSEHINLEILDKAQELARYGLALAKRNKDQSLKCSMNYHMGNIELLFTNHQQALTENEVAFEVCAKTNQAYMMPLIKYQKFSILTATKDLKKAESYFNEIREDLFSSNWLLLEIEAKIRLAELSLQLGKLEQVESLAKEGYQFAKEKNDTNNIKSSSEVLAKYYKRVGDLEKSEFYLKEYQEASVELSSQLRQKRIAYYQAMNIRKKNRIHPNKLNNEVAAQD